MNNKIRIVSQLRKRLPVTVAGSLIAWLVRVAAGLTLALLSGASYKTYQQAADAAQMVGIISKQVQVNTDKIQANESHIQQLQARPVSIVTQRETRPQTPPSQPRPIVEASVASSNTVLRLDADINTRYRAAIAARKRSEATVKKIKEAAVADRHNRTYDETCEALLAVGLTCGTAANPETKPIP